MACAFGHKTYRADCDACDSHSHDPHTGWSGFRDHFAKKDFSSSEEQTEYYRKARERGETGEWTDSDTM